MITMALFWLWMLMMFMMMQTSSPGQNKEPEPPPKIERLAVLRRDFVDPSAPQTILVSASLATHMRLTRGGKTWEIGGRGEPVEGFYWQFVSPIHLQNGLVAYSTDDLLAIDRERREHAE